MADDDDSFGIGDSQVNPREDESKNLAQGEIGGAAAKARPGLTAAGHAALRAERAVGGSASHAAQAQQHHVASAAGTAAAGIGSSAAGVGAAAAAAASAAAPAASNALDRAREASRATFTLSAESARAAAAAARSGAASAAASSGLIFGNALARIRAAGLVAEQQARAILANTPPPNLAHISAATGAAVSAVAEVVPIVELDMGAFVSGAVAAGRGAGSALVSGAGAAAAAAAQAASAGGSAAARVAGDAAHAAGDAAAAAASAAAPIAGQVASQAAAAGSVAWDAAGDAASAAGSAASSAARAAAPIAGQVGSAAVTGARAAGTAVAGAAGAIANSGVVRAGAQNAAQFLSSAKDAAAGVGGFAWDAAGQAYEVSRDGLAVAMAAAAGGVAFIWAELVKVEVFRDILQQLNVIFSTVARAALEASTQLFNWIASLVNLNFETFSVNPVVVIALVGVLAAIIVIAYVWMMCVVTGLSGETDEIKHGAEARTWEEISEENKNKTRAIKIIMTAAISVYLPVAKLVVQILSCNAQLMVAAKQLWSEIQCGASVNNDGVAIVTCDCSTWPLHTGFMVLAVLLLLVFVLGLPILCYYLIQKNKPIGSEDDPTKRWAEVNGKDELVEYTATMYQSDLRSDPRQIHNPFLFLYEGYERQWAFYKVLQMVFKLFLVLPAILLVQQGNLAASLVLLAVLGVYAGIAFYAAPFINPQADYMDAAGRITTLVTVGFALISSPEVAPGAATAMGVLINVVNAVNFLILLMLLLYSLPPVKRFLKNMLGRFTFSDSVRDVTGRADLIVEHWIVYDELRNRIWRPFFASLLMQADPTVPDPEDKEAVEAAKQLTVEEKKLSVTRRLMAQSQVSSTVGTGRIKAHWRSLALPGMMETMGWVQANLEGVDVYFDALPHDGHKDWVTGFGKMFVRPYPFAAVVVWDEGEDHFYVYAADSKPTPDPTPVNQAVADAVAATEAAWGRKMTTFERLVYLNRDCPEIRRQAHVRRSLRAMAKSERRFPLYFTLTVTRMVTVTRTNSEGKTETRSESITVHLTFHTVVVEVGANTNKRYAAGFKAAVVGIDGEGSGTSSDGRTHHFTNQRERAPCDISAGYQVSGLLLELFTKAEAKAAVAEFMPVLDREVNEYRRELYEQRAKEERALSNAFTLHVYDAFPLPRPALEAYLTEFEQNEVMKSLVVEHKAGLDFLYARVRLVTRHPVAGFWWLFFQDLWAENNTMSCFKNEELRRKWDPRYPDAICYRPMPRGDLVKELAEMGLHRSRGLFDDALLDLLYKQIETRTSAVVNPVHAASASSVAAV